MGARGWDAVRLAWVSWASWGAMSAVATAYAVIAAIGTPAALNNAVIGAVLSGMAWFVAILIGVRKSRGGAAIGTVLALGMLLLSVPGSSIVLSTAASSNLPLVALMLAMLAWLAVVSGRAAHQLRTDRPAASDQVARGPSTPG